MLTPSRSSVAPRPEKCCHGADGVYGKAQSAFRARAVTVGASKKPLVFSAPFRSLRAFRGNASLSLTRLEPRNRRGISLLEAVVAIAIVGITSVSALEAVGGDMRTAERARRAIVVEQLAGSRMEFMDLMTDQELQALPDSVEAGKFPAPLDEYSWKTSSAVVSDQDGIYDVRVQIDWPTGSYLVKTYQYRQPRVVTRR